MISNASPLINFAKLNKLDLLLKCAGNLAISEGVFEEVAGEESPSQEAQLIRAQIANGKVVMKKLNAANLEKAKNLQETFGKLGVGESQTIALALQEGEKEALIDDSAAREAAELFGISPKGTLRMLLIAFEKRIISAAEAKELFAKMVENKFWVGADIALRFTEILSKLEKSRNKRS